MIIQRSFWCFGILIHHEIFVNSISEWSCSTVSALAKEPPHSTRRVELQKQKVNKAHDSDCAEVQRFPRRRSSADIIRKQAAVRALKSWPTSMVRDPSSLIWAAVVQGRRRRLSLDEDSSYSAICQPSHKEPASSHINFSVIGMPLCEEEVAIP